MVFLEHRPRVYYIQWKLVSSIVPLLEFLVSSSGTRGPWTSVYLQGRRKMFLSRGAPSGVGKCGPRSGLNLGGSGGPPPENFVILGALRAHLANFGHKMG